MVAGTPSPPTGTKPGESEWISATVQLGIDKVATHAPSTAPTGREPTSPIKTLAGGIFNQRNGRIPPARAPRTGYRPDSRREVAAIARPRTNTRRRLPA